MAAPRRLLALIALATASALPAVASARSGHVHGLGIDPGDGAVLVATHEGLLRSSGPGRGLRRVGASRADLMGFAVSGARRYLASGHPGAGEGGPAALGLIASADGGRTWRSRSLRGQVDFHVLRAVGRQVAGMDSGTGKLLISTDAGRRWTSASPPRALVDLAIEPVAQGRLLVAFDSGLALSADGGRTWRSLPGGTGLIAWPRAKRLWRLDASGRLLMAVVPAGPWRVAGRVPGIPVALAASPDGRVVVALQDGRVLGRSATGWFTLGRVG